jgi:hypothetical protein
MGRPRRCNFPAGFGGSWLTPPILSNKNHHFNEEIKKLFDGQTVFLDK